jgi:hypothetical protein
MVLIRYGCKLIIEVEGDEGLNKRLREIRLERLMSRIKCDEER